MKNLIFLLFVGFFPAQQTWNLQQCLDYASTHHPLIKQATVTVTKNDQMVKSSKGMLLPSAEAGVRRDYSFGSSINQTSNQREALNTQYDQFYAQADWGLFNWKNILNISLSGLNKETSAYQLKQARNKVKLDVVQKFFAYQNSKSLLEVLETQISGIKDQILRTEKEVEIGNRPKSDVYDIKANLGTLQEQWVSAKNQRDQTKINLINALSVTHDSLDFIMNDESLSDAEFNDPDFTQKLLQKNPAYQAAIAEMKAQEKREDIAKAGYLPTLDGRYRWSTFYNKVLGKDNVSDKSFSDQFAQNKNHFLSLGISIPVFNKLQVKTNVEIAKLNVISSRYDRDLIINDLTQSINSIRAQFLNAREKYNLLDSNFENQRLSFQKSEEKYREGLIDAYAFFVVRNGWLQANYNLISSKNDLIQQKELLKILESGL
ncbi:TolC family protein [Chryseobacterium indologenes]|uniref:TolC family protein n=1 Tax=Chryseobacterium indologenes TaxID=253 RepID=UPI000F516874|nr:TolC family protein [Chryseobacterium indologenes]AYZ36347.1 TolC family protein [Chryseobacterium indologenes]MBF6645004.1 TolC family protein [Chryseobacterium indologenes]MBU3047913.1 TolC family protein [Chryseobacterium indologenes]MEB4759280.1 TolC family protein [Chryseobacterium indologenes]QQQ71318.1 TolC family protein [Chryseobacterium indologenes]